MEGTVPSAFQIRFAGCKGVVAVDPTMEESLKLQIRPSMRKFDTKHSNLEVIRAATFQPGHLNREIIVLLSSLSIQDKEFLSLQRDMVDRYNNALTHNEVKLWHSGRRQEESKLLVTYWKEIRATRAYQRVAIIIGV